MWIICHGFYGFVDQSLCYECSFYASFCVKVITKLRISESFNNDLVLMRLIRSFFCLLYIHTIHLFVPFSLFHVLFINTVLIQSLGYWKSGS